MGKKNFKTYVKADHKLSGNEYIKGRISGIARVICGEAVGVGLVDNEGGVLMFHTCTKRQYEKFRKIIEELYPDLCTFKCDEC
jgi:hypothetical protein